MKYKYLILLLLLPILAGAQITVDNNTHTDEYLQRIDFSSVFQDSTNGNVWVASDAEGNETRPIQQGRCYQFDAVDDSISFGLPSTVISYWDGVERRTVTTTANGDLLFSDLSTTRKFGDAYTGTVGNYTHYWHCDEQDGTISYDCVGSANGTINNAVLSTFHAIDNSYKSYQNEIAYSDSSSVLIPIALNSAGIGTGLDINGSVPTYSGRVKYNAQLINGSMAFFDGVSAYAELDNYVEFCLNGELSFSFDFDNLNDGNNYIFGSGNIDNKYGIRYSTTSNTFLLLTALSGFSAIEINGTGISIIKIVRTGVDEYTWYKDSIMIGTTSSGSNLGLYIKTIGGRNIPILLGYRGRFTFMQIIDSLGITKCLYEATEGAGDTLYNKETENNCIIKGANITKIGIDPFWVKDSTGVIPPLNLANSFDLWADSLHLSDRTYDLRIPSYTSGISIKTDGDTVAGYTWVSRNIAGEYHNKAETELKQFLAPALIAYDPGFWYTSGVANSKSWEEINQFGLKVFVDKTGYKMDNVGLSTIWDIKIDSNYLPAKIEVAQ